MENTAPAGTYVDVMLRVNGSARRLRLDSRVTLLDALRDELDLTGTKKGCDQGAAAPARCCSTASACCRA
jgi:xanthine dehydrogenase YagT iron-sulfur-binding subunit